jgi:hypothetical protein
VDARDDCLLRDDLRREHAGTVARDRFGGGRTIVPDELEAFR